MTLARLLIAILLALPPARAAPAGAAPGPAPTAAAVIRPKRLVHFFDFEERKFGNFEDLPMHWYMIGRPAQTSDPDFLRQPLHQALIHRRGFPAYTTVRFDTRDPLSGELSFHLGLNGGNAGAFLEVGTLPAVPSSDYLVTAGVRTRGLDRAAARIVAYFVDAHGVPIAASRTGSPPIRDAAEWTAVSVKLPGRFPDAAWIVLELELTQPAADPADPLGSQQIVLQDVAGGVWFDDISVWQLPHVEVRTQSPVNMVRSPQRPRLSVEVRDLTGQRLHADLTIYDHRHRRVAQTTRPVGAGEPMTWEWEPDLPGFGWYLADLRVYEESESGGGPIDGPVARTLSTMLWLPPDGALFPDDRRRFVLGAQGLPESEMKLLPAILDATRLDAVVVSAWTTDTTLGALARQQDRLDQTLEKLLVAGHGVTLSLDPVPRELAEMPGVEADRPLAVLRADPDLWLAYLAPVLMRQGQRIDRWQLGRSDRAQAFYHDDLPELLAGVRRQFTALAPQPRLIVPWRAGQARRPELGRDITLALDVPTAAAPEHLPAQVAAWSDPPTPVVLYLHEPPADLVDHDSRVADLALRMVRGWEALVAGMALPRPWTAAVGRRNAIWPDPLLGVFSNVAQRLAGRQVLGRLPLGRGLRGLILDGPRGGMIVAWNRSADRRNAAIDMYLGESPVAIDVWGNRAPVPLVGGRHRLTLTQTPVFITGIDAELALLRASFKVEPAFVEALQTPHPHTVILRNPWGRTISGSLLFTGPESWQVQPVRHRFSLAAGQWMRLPVELSFPFAELAGPKRLTARIEFTADRHYEIELSAPMELGLPDVEFHPTVALEPGSKPGLVDAELVCIVTNTGGKPRSLSAFANLRGHPRQERSIARLLPGQSIVRRFTFHDLTAEDRIAPLRAGIREINGPAVLNRLLPLNVGP